MTFFSPTPKPTPRLSETSSEQDSRQRQRRMQYGIQAALLRTALSNYQKRSHFVSKQKTDSRQRKNSNNSYKTVGDIVYRSVPGYSPDELNTLLEFVMNSESSTLKTSTTTFSQPPIWSNGRKARILTLALVGGLLRGPSFATCSVLLRLTRCILRSKR